MSFRNAVEVIDEVLASRRAPGLSGAWLDPEMARLLLVSTQHVAFPVQDPGGSGATWSLSPSHGTCRISVIMS
jgi:hypothetical protein